MAFPNNIDFDKLINVVLEDFGTSIHGWISGRVLEEVALMNRLTEQLSRRRRGCDVGLTSPVSVRCEVSVLHRKGIKQVDRYGSDLAVTVYVDNTLVKTALFQLKKSNNLSLILEREQLEDATLDARTKKRAFVLAVDETRQIVRLHDVDSLLSTYNRTQETKTFQSTRWESLARWVWKWLSCDIGERSDPSDPNSVEGLLQQFIVPEGLITSWGRQVEHDLPEDFVPARLWLKLYFESKES